MKNRVLYLGNFDYTNGFAAVNRAIGNSVLFNYSGFETLIYCKNSRSIADSTFFSEHNISFIDRPACSKFDAYFKYKEYLQLIKKINGLKVVVLYNFPSFPFSKILKFCKRNDICVISDTTEWYDTKSCSFLLKPIKKMDTSFRLRNLNKKCDGCILISNYLLNYYSKVERKILIYPIMDFVVWESKRYDFNVENKEKCKITLIGSSISSKDDISYFETLLSKKENYELSIIGLDKNYDIKNKNIHCYGHLPREGVYKALSESTFSYVVRRGTRANNAGFPTKFAESIVLNIPIIYSRFSDIPLLEQKYIFGFEKESFIKTNCETVEISKELKCLFLADHYKDSMHTFLKDTINSKL